MRVFSAKTGNLSLVARIGHCPHVIRVHQNRVESFLEYSVDARTQVQREFRRGKKRPFVSKLGCGLALSSTENIEPRHIASGVPRWGTL